MGVIRVVLTDLDGVVRRWPATQFSSVEDAHRLPRGCMARAAWSASAGDVDTGTLDVLQAARRSVALGLVSNATTRLADDLSRLGIADAFDFIVNSSTVGCAKPSACFYEHALHRCGCTRHQVFFVDDRPDNVAGANDFGFHAHLYRDPSTLEQALRAARVLSGRVAEGR